MRESLAVLMENIMYTIRECEWHRDNLLAAKSVTPVCPRTVKIIQDSYTQRREHLRQVLDLKPPLSDASNTILGRSYLATNYADAPSQTTIKEELVGAVTSSELPSQLTSNPMTRELLPHRIAIPSVYLYLRSPTSEILDDQPHQIL
ncbi:hypothetical protein TI39_contig5963g00001 [Zymoseptoria brevis]|uniref:Uncharacterized protein n=1 Tax=Zymoseptoria brevis TaxID=1047168 RepID=A0A0F4G406_9PEZI|nr:hypothetical protein TI39_contig5963g00001 [Zymoseptoria brevis]